ncbi:unnamed protein product [Symbiodinium sp. KB8]|nr:unnamed protein product [Symbiodinium sp. KB8]
MEPAETPDPIPATQVTSPAPTPEPPVPDTQPEAKQPQEPAAPPKPIAPSTSPTQPEAKVLPKPAALSKPPSSAEAKTREPAQKKQAAKPEPEDDDEYRAPADEKPPPAPISKQTLMKRLARICSPKEDGTYKVPLEIIQSHKNLDTRDTVYRAFEKCGYDPVFPPRLSVSATITGGGGYEEINEKMVETEFEFLTEQEMEEKGWSEKSDYCDEWMYWVAVKVKGSNKKTKRHTVTELLEGGDDEPMADPDEAMDEFPFELEGDGGAKGKTGEDDSSDDSSDDGEEAARILKKIRFPDISRKPQDSCVAVATCLQARASKLQLVVDKIDEQSEIPKGHEKSLT